MTQTGKMGEAENPSGRLRRHGGRPAPGGPRAWGALPPRPEAPPGQSVPKAVRSRPPRRGLQPRPLRAPWSATGSRLAPRSLGCRRPLDAFPARPPIRAAPRPVCRGRSGSANRPGRIRWLPAALPSETLASSLASGFVASRNAQSPRSGPTSPRHRIMVHYATWGLAESSLDITGLCPPRHPGGRGGLYPLRALRDAPGLSPDALCARDRLVALRTVPGLTAGQRLTEDRHSPLAPFRADGPQAATFRRSTAALVSRRPLFGARARTPFAHDRCAGPAGGVAGLHPVAAGPHARFVSRCARPGRPRCAPSSLCLRHSLTPSARFAAPGNQLRHLHDK